MDDFNPQLLFYNTRFDYAVWTMDEQQLNSVFSSANQKTEMKQNLETESSEPQKTVQAKVIDPKLTCKGCKKTLTTTRRFEIHCVCCKKLADYEAQLFKCKRCIRKFEKRSSLRKHFRKHHIEKDENPQRPEDISKKPTSIFHSISSMAESDSKK